MVLLKFLSNMMLPPTSMFVGLLVAGVIRLFGWRKPARAIAIMSILETLLMALPAVTDLLMAPLEHEAREAAAMARPCCYSAIVVLGGGIRPASPPLQPNPDLGEASDRLWEASRLYHRAVAPVVVVSGGDIVGNPGNGAASTEAAAMAQFLRDLGVPDSAIVQEVKALNTRENMKFSHALEQDKAVALVTSGYHMPRALKLARQAGLNVAAFPTDWHPTWHDRSSWGNWLPNAASLEQSAIALWEYIALTFDHRR